MFSSVIEISQRHRERERERERERAYINDFKIVMTNIFRGNLTAGFFIMTGLIIVL